MNAVQVLADPVLAMLREQRAELRESMSALERSLAAPAVGRLDFWAQRVAVALVELSGDFRTHVAITEGPDGLHPDIVRVAPRLANAVERLGGEHTVIAGLIEEVIALAGASGLESPDELREKCTTLLGRLVRHRQRGADLIFEAYETDIGGET